MATVLRTTTGQKVRVPDWVVDHESFLRWYWQSDVPEDVRIGFINGQVWIDPMSERAFAHNRVKTAVAETVGPIVRAGDLGVFFGDGMMFTTPAGGFTSVPDGVFVSHDSEAVGRVWLSGAKKGQHDTRLNGTPDLIVEVVSDHSEDKDTEWLMAGYWNAGIPEYWLIDARGGDIAFTIYRRGVKGFAAVRKTDGWAKSEILGKSFRFVQRNGAFGKTDYALEVS
jgi:Uma2 family endonuclease